MFELVRAGLHINVLVLTLFLATPYAAFAARHALLVGVSNYPSQSGAKPLPGATNDVQLLNETLQRRGFKRDEITILSDGINGATSPTRRNIMQALEKLVASAAPGDFFFVHLSGHGSQQPVDPKRKSARAEPDGLNETFLPIDIGRWDGARSTVSNAIVDFELDALLETMNINGAFVWGSFDACHSASLMRGAPEAGMTLRNVDPQALGVPKALLDEVQAQAVVSRGQPIGEPALETQRSRSSEGGFVAFYAAQTSEETLELAMPREKPAGASTRKVHGVFTYTLAEAINTHEVASYRELMQFILMRYSAQVLSQKPSPVLSGTHLDAIAFGGAKAAGPRQWAIRQEAGVLRIGAGYLAQIREGTEFSVVADPLAVAGKQLGVAVTKRVSAFVSELELRGAGADILPEGAHARLVRPARGALLRVAAPAASSGPLPKDLAQVLQTLRTDAESLRVAWVAENESADVVLHVADEQLWFLPASGVLSKAGLNKTPSLSLAHEKQKLSELLADSLRRMAKAISLMRLAQQVPGDAAGGRVRVELVRLPDTADGATRPLTAAAIETLPDGARVGFSITNKAHTPFDVTILYFDSAFGIAALFPGAGEDNRIMPGSVLSSISGAIDPITINAETLGVERLLVIATPAEPQSERTDYSYLAQPRLERARGSGPASSLLSELLEEAAFGTSARGATRGASAEAFIQTFAWEVVKR